MKNQLVCAVCGGPSDCSHFGVISCRACSAFFRRKVVECREIAQRCAGRCEVTTRRRNSCVKCRFEKCLKMGMKITAVYRRLEKSRLPNPLESAFLADPLTIFEQLQESYNKLTEARKSTFTQEKSDSPKLFNYKTMNSVLRTDFKIMIATTVASLELMTDIESTQHKHLLNNFFLKFYLLDCGFKSKGKYVFVLPTNDFMDLEHREFFYSSDEKNGSREHEYVVNIMTPYWNKMGSHLVDHFAELQIDFQEFLFLTAILYWDICFQEQTIECQEKCRRMRKKVIEELTRYEENHEGGQKRDPSLRVGDLMMLLNSLQKIVILMEEVRDVLVLYNIQEFHETMFEALSF